MSMPTGITAPVAHISGVRASWEESAGIAEIATVAQTAERLGFDFITCGEHVALPAGLHRGERFYDPLATFSYLAAVTERIRFLTYVLVLPFYHPLEIAKRYGTLDHISGGRLTLGVGVGNLEEEFAALDVDYAGRGAQANDALRALRAILGKREVSYSGTHYSFEAMVVDPPARQEHVPLWIGGDGRLALRRALTLGDAWAPGPSSHGGPTLAKLRELLDQEEAPADLEVLYCSAEALDPMGDPDQVRDLLGRCAEAGVTSVRLVVQQDSMAELCDQLAAYAELNDQQVR